MRNYVPEGNRDISTLIHEQYFPGIHASELFVRATAMYLNIAILVVMENSTAQWPYDIYWPNWLGNRTKTDRRASCSLNVHIT